MTIRIMVNGVIRDATPEEEAEIIAAQEEPQPAPEEIPGPSVLVMSTSNVIFHDGEPSVENGGFNFGGIVKTGPGQYSLFTLKGLSGDLFDPWFSVGGGFTLTATVVDSFMVVVEARDINGVLADPILFSMRIYQP